MRVSDVVPMSEPGALSIERGEARLSARWYGQRVPAIAVLLVPRTIRLMTAGRARERDVQQEQPAEKRPAQRAGIS